VPVVEGEEAAVGAEDDGAGVVAVDLAGVQLQAGPVEVLGAARERGSGDGECALERVQVDEERAVEILGEDDRASDRERVARGEDGLESGAMQGLGEAAEVVAEGAGVAAVAGGEHDQAERAGVGREQLTEPTGVEERRGADLPVESEAEGGAGGAAVGEEVEHGERSTGRFGGRERVREGSRGGVREDVAVGVEEPTCPSDQAAASACLCSAAGTPPPAADQANRTRPPSGLGAGFSGLVAVPGHSWRSRTPGSSPRCWPESPTTTSSQGRA
jgi:hypothetical protein